MTLVDLNIWLALLLPPHRHHQTVRVWWDQLQEQEAFFCRSTQIGLLRLLTTESVLQAYQIPARTQDQAWAIYDKLMEDDCVDFLPEPPGTEAFWRKLCSGSLASPKLWMDAYLAAFAIAGGYQLITLDKGFRQFETKGLKLKLLTTV